LTLGQSGWACDDPDPNEYLCVEELDIKKVRLDYDKDEIRILGRNFTNGAKPTVTLGDDGLVVLSYNDTEIVTNFPFVEAGQYKLRISTGEGSHCKDKHSVKIDHDNEPSCPQPPPCTPCKDGEPGPQGPKGDKGDPGVKSAEAITLPSGSQATASLNTDTSVLTIGVPKGDKGDPGLNGTNGQDGAPGLQGPPGILGWQIKSVVVYVVDADGNYSGTAPCDAGYRVTGGGFSQSEGLEILESKPLLVVVEAGTEPIGIGWQAVAAPKPDVVEAFIEIWAVCAKVQ
jgi:hypothetical protein